MIDRDRWMDGWLDGWVDGFILIHTLSYFNEADKHILHRPHLNANKAASRLFQHLKTYFIFTYSINSVENGR